MPNLLAILPTILTASAAAYGSSATYFEHPLLALFLCMVSGVSGVAAWAQYKGRPLFSAKTRGTGMLAAGLAVFIFAYFEAPETNNLYLIALCFPLGAALEVALPIVEKWAPSAVKVWLKGRLKDLGNFIHESKSGGSNEQE